MKDNEPDMCQDLNIGDILQANAPDMCQDLNIGAMGQPNVPNLGKDFVPSLAEVDPSVPGSWEETKERG